MIDKCIVNLFDKTLTNEELKRSILYHKDINEFILDCFKRIPKNVDNILVDICSDSNLINIIEIYCLDSYNRHKYVSSLYIHRSTMINIVREHTLNEILNN